jgi:hypothetical protein
VAETTTVQLDDLLTQAQPIVRARLGQELTLGEPQLLKDATRMVVVRAHVRASHHAPDTPRSVIIKAIRDDPATGFSEWASLAFMDELPQAHTIAPRFLGGSVAQRLFAISDLGPGCTLHDTLCEATPAEVDMTLTRLGRQMARLHAITAGRERDFERIRHALPAAEQTGRRREAERWLGARGRLAAWFAAAGCDLPAGFDAALEQIAAAYAEPGAWLTFSHGDPAPSNSHIAGDNVWLLDFEYGAFRHALYDISAWNVLCPLPQCQVQLLVQAFQEALAAHMPAVADRAAFEGAWGLLCVYRALAILSWVEPAVLSADRPMVGDWSAREAVLAALTRSLAADRLVAALAPVAIAAERLCAALRARWPEFSGRDDIATRWPALM